MSGTSPIEQDAASLAATADSVAAKVETLGTEAVSAANTVAAAAANVGAAVTQAEADAKAVVAVLGPLIADGEKFCATAYNGVVTVVKSITADALSLINYIHTKL